MIGSQVARDKHLNVRPRCPESSLDHLPLRKVVLYQNLVTVQITVSAKSVNLKHENKSLEHLYFNIDNINV